MAEIFTEIIIVKKYKFCVEIWDIIKEYMGLHGINLELPDIMAKLTINEIDTYNRMCFGIRSKTHHKKIPHCNFFYNNLRLKNVEDVNRICDIVINDYKNRKFKVPEDLKIGETILLYNYGYMWEKSAEIGTISKINKESFTVKIKEKIDGYSGVRYVDRVRYVKNNNYLRKEKAKEYELRFFDRTP
jgi:hypothetical protein